MTTRVSEMLCGSIFRAKIPVSRYKLTVTNDTFSYLSSSLPSTVSSLITGTSGLNITQLLLPYLKLLFFP